MFTVKKYYDTGYRVQIIEIGITDQLILSLMKSKDLYSNVSCLLIYCTHCKWTLPHQTIYNQQGTDFIVIKKSMYVLCTYMKTFFLKYGIKNPKYVNIEKIYSYGKYKNNIKYVCI